MGKKSKSSQSLFQKFEYLDIFGSEPKFFINDKQKYRTKFGAVLTIMLLCVVGTACWIYGNDMHFKRNPNVSFAEEFSIQPEHFNINKNNLNFAVGLTNSYWEHYLDESIYTVQMNQFIQRQVQNEQGETVTEMEINPIKTKICEQSDFGASKDYFKSITWMSTLYCPENYDDMFIEGDYGQKIFATIHINFYPCQNTTESQHCKSPEVIEEAIQDNFYSTYISDSLVDPKDFNQPFQNIGRNVYGTSSGKMYKQIDFQYRITDIVDNTGIIFDHFQEKKGLTFTGEKEFMKWGRHDDGLFLKIQIRQEKVKKTKIHRTYLNMAEVLAKVGGILKVFMLSFAIMAGFVADKFYKMQMVNNVFQFIYKDDEDKKKEKRRSKINSKLMQKDEEQNSQEIEKDYRDTPKNIKFKSITSLLTNFCQKKEVKEHKKLLEYADLQIIHYLNMTRVLEKMMEIDKLKLVLFNKKQKQLFDYLPKPVVSMEILEGKKTDTLKKYPSNIIGQDLRSPEEKEKDAMVAYQQLRENRGKNLLDKKIISILEKTAFGSKVEHAVSIGQMNLKNSQENQGDDNTPGIQNNETKDRINQLKNQDNVIEIAQSLNSNFRNQIESTTQNMQNIQTDRHKNSTFSHRYNQDYSIDLQNNLDGDWYSNINNEYDLSKQQIMPSGSSAHLDFNSKNMFFDTTDSQLNSPCPSKQNRYTNKNNQKAINYNIIKKPPNK